MGDVWIPDRALTIDELHACLKILEEKWGRSEIDFQERMELLSGSTGGLRGEELPQIDVGFMRKHWSEGEDHPRQNESRSSGVGRSVQEVSGRETFLSASGRDH